MKKYIFISLLLSLAIGCRDNRRLDAALEFAGENRVELERVLEHYRDSGLKYEAARFLIENMPGWYAYRGMALDSGKAVLLSMDSNNIILPAKAEGWKEQLGGRYEKVYDAQVMTADYLIANIDRAFAAWEGRPWNKYLPFEDFCECILPYRIGNEPLEKWWEACKERYAYLVDSVYCGTDVIEAARGVATRLREEGFIYNWQMSLPHLGALFLLEHRVGTCVNACDLAVYVMRALGIPVTIDFYPYCSEVRNGHEWCAVRDTTGRHWGFQFTDNLPERDKPYLDGRKSGKILRRKYANPRYVDASADYFPDTLKLEVSDSKVDYQYIGVFHPDHHWVVVDGTEVKRGKAIFPHVEREVIYAPLVKGKDSKFETSGYPFYFDGKEAHPYIPDTVHRDTVVLWRKYPLLAWTAAHLAEICGGRFELSNTKDFSSIEYAYVVADTPRVAYNEIILPQSVRCRYVRYVAPAGKRTELAELQLYTGKQLHNPVYVEGSKLENVVTVKANVFDGDPLSYYYTWELGATLWADLGEQALLDRFVFIPQNDDNFIRLGDTYELFYHGGKDGWISLGRQTAKDLSLTYAVPRGALLHLRCLTRGEEEQIFHMENGKQVFISNFD